MPFLSLRYVSRTALCLLLLALPASLRAESFEVPINSWTTKADVPATVKFTMQCTVFLGCLDPTKTYQIYLDGSYMVGVPAGSTQWTFAYPYGTETGGNPSYHPSGTREFKITHRRKFQLRSNATGNTNLDEQEHIWNLKGTVTYQSGATVSIPAESRTGVFMLKPGGPSAGKTRGPGSMPGDVPEDPGQVIDLFSYIPPYQTGEGGQTGKANQPVPFSRGGQSGTIPTGPGWQRVIVPGGSVGSTGLPPWAAGIGNTLERTPSGHGGNVGLLYNPELPNAIGDPPSTPNCYVSSGPGGTHVSGGPIGNTFDMSFPKGYKPKETDLRDPKPGDTGSLNVDPCFAHALETMGLPPPGVGPGGPVDPPGTPRDFDVPPPPTTGPPGGGGPDLPPEIRFPPPGGPGGRPPILPPGGGGGGGGGGTPGGGGTTQPPKDPGDGKAPSEPGGALPEDEASKGYADELGRKFRDGVSRVQTAVDGLRSKGTVTQTGFGQAGGWIINLPFAGRSYSMTIPTEHAPLIRRLLFILLTGCFLIACYNLLLGK